jgi:hypothetical protein
VLTARRVLALFVAALLVGLVPAAYADPPDPSWIGGFWDDDDFDTVVAYIASTSATLAETGVDAEPSLVWVARVDTASPDFLPPPLRNVSRPRAPPVGSLSHC